MNDALQDLAAQALHIAAFSDGTQGGNPAGVLISDVLPEAALMQALATQLGYSETVFAAAAADGSWRVRYFSPEAEVPFCGHATIALGAALALREGDGLFHLQLNHARISVQGHRPAHPGEPLRAALQSPPTHSALAAPDAVQEALQLFGLSTQDLSPAIAPREMQAGAQHLLLVLASRERLAQMHYDLAQGRALQTRHDWTTITLAWVEHPQRFHVRNAFAVGGVLEDPATGAAAAALGGALRDIAWPHGGHIDIVQGEDMGMRSLLAVDISPEVGASIRVSGQARLMQGD